MTEEQEILGSEDDISSCLSQQVEEEELYVSHVFVTKSGEVFYAYKSIELAENQPNGEIEIVVAIDALNYPEKGDRSIVIIPKHNIDHTQEFYQKSTWDTLMNAAISSQCEQIVKYASGTHGIYQ